MEPWASRGEVTATSAFSCTAFVAAQKVLANRMLLRGNLRRLPPRPSPPKKLGGGGGYYVQIEIWGRIGSGRGDPSSKIDHLSCVLFGILFS